MTGKKKKIDCLKCPWQISIWVMAGGWRREEARKHRVSVIKRATS